MSIKATMTYTTSDGQKHDTRAAALKHEAGYKVRNGLEEQFKALAPGRMPTEFSLNLITDVKKLKELRDLCNKGMEYHRNYGSLKNKK